MQDELIERDMTMKHWIRFERPARRWNEALPIGNGFMGAMVYGGVNHERLQVNEDSVWSGGLRERTNGEAANALPAIRELLRAGDSAKAHRLAASTMLSPLSDCSHYESLGAVDIRFGDDYAGRLSDPREKTGDDWCSYTRGLDIDHALGEIAFERVDGVETTHERRGFFASNPDRVMVYGMASEDEDISFEVTCSRNSLTNHWLNDCGSNEVVDERTIALSGVNGGADGIGYVLMARVECIGGTCRSVGRRIVVEHAKCAMVLLTARTTFRDSDPRSWCIKTLDNASRLGYRDLRRRHVTDYRRYYGRTELRLGGEDGSRDAMATGERLRLLRRGAEDLPLVETYCDYAKYLLISSSRPGSLPANLQGLWCQDFDSAWGSKYTVNINLEMNYWFAEAMNLPEMHIPLLEHVRRMLPSGRRVARRMYGVEGFVCHHNTDIWGDCAPVDDALTASLWPFGAAWLCLHLIDHEHYTRDETGLKDYMPVIEQAVRFLINVEVRDECGRWVVGPSVSPENKYRDANGSVGSLCMGSSIDNQITRELFNGYLFLADSCTRNGEADIVDDTLAQVVRERLDQLPGIAIGDDGKIREWDRQYQEVEPGHRHFSPLFGLYPGSLIRSDKTPDLSEAALRTLVCRIEAGASTPNAAGQTGWSRAWSSILFARLGEGDRAWDGLLRLIDSCSFDNLLNADDLQDLDTPFQIDGNFGGLTALLEMLIRDYDDVVMLLPALPECLSDGLLRGVVCRSGCIVDMQWRGGEVSKLHIRGLREGSVKLRFNRIETDVTFHQYDEIDVIGQNLQ